MYTAKLQPCHRNSKAWKVFKGAGWQQMQPAWASLRLLGRLMQGEEDSEDAVEALIQTASSMPPQWPFLGLVRFCLLFLGVFLGRLDGLSIYLSIHI